MSGHAGFQAIGTHLPPPNAGPQLGSVAGTGRDTEPRKPAGPGGVEANAQGPEAQPSTARSLAQNLIPAAVSRAQTGVIYASEADVLNVALFGRTHQQWQTAHPGLPGNQRDHATVNQLICLSNLENINAVMINDGMPQPQRLRKLNEIAIQQMRILAGVGGRKLLRDPTPPEGSHRDSPA